MHKRVMIRRVSSVALLFVVAMLSVAQKDAEARRGGGSDFSEALTAGAGVVSPGAQGAAVYNPAGLVYNSRFKLQIHGDAYDTSAQILGEGLRLTYGTGNVAATVGGHYLNPTQGISVDAGLGFYVDAIKTAFGVNWGFPVYQGGSAGAMASSDGSVGILINPTGRFQLGVAGFNLLNTISRNLGGGLAYKISPNLTLLSDVIYFLNGGQIVLVPALKVHFSPAQFSFGYAVNLNSGVGTLASSIRAGVGFDISNRVQLHFYYNQFVSYHGALQIQL